MVAANVVTAHCSVQVRASHPIPCHVNRWVIRSNRLTVSCSPTQAVELCLNGLACPCTATPYFVLEGDVKLGAPTNASAEDHCLTRKKGGSTVEHLHWSISTTHHGAIQVEFWSSTPQAQVVPFSASERPFRLQATSKTGFSASSTPLSLHGQGVDLFRYNAQQPLWHPLRFSRYYIIL